MQQDDTWYRKLSGPSFTRKWRFVHVQLPNGVECPSDFLLFLDNLLMFYQAFGVNLSFNRCDMFVAGGACASISYCTSIYKDVYGIGHIP